MVLVKNIKCGLLVMERGNILGLWVVVLIGDGI
jgi:hypothetical protein